MLYSKYPPDLVREALNFSSHMEHLLRLDIFDSIIHDPTVWLPSFSQEVKIPSIAHVNDRFIDWKDFIVSLYKSTLLAAEQNNETGENIAQRWHQILSAMGEAALPYLYDTLPERQFMKIVQMEVVTSSIASAAPHLPWELLPGWRWGHYASMYIDIPEKHGEFWSIREVKTGWTTAHMASFHGRAFTSEALLTTRTESIPYGLTLDTTHKKDRNCTMEDLSVASVYYLSGHVFPQIHSYFKAPFDSEKETLIEGIIGKGTKHQDPSWLSGTLRNLYLLYEKVPLERIGRLAALLFRRLQNILYPEQILRYTVSEMSQLLFLHAGRNAAEKVLSVFEGMVPESPYWLIPS